MSHILISNSEDVLIGESGHLGVLIELRSNDFPNISLKRINMLVNWGIHILIKLKKLIYNWLKFKTTTFDHNIISESKIKYFP